MQGHSGGTAERPVWPIRRGKVSGKIETTIYYRDIWVIWVHLGYLSNLSYICCVSVISSSF